MDDTPNPEPPSQAIPGRGATCSPHPRFVAAHTEQVDDGWTSPGDCSAPQTRVRTEHPKSLLTYNQSPDIPFDRTINPYRGCEHGCVYCFARPTHAYLDLSPGLDFETRLVWKQGAADVLARELSRPGYQCQPVQLGASTDPYQPIERRYRVTREVLETLLHFNHPVSIVTKGALIERDIDVLQALAERRLVSVAVSLTTLDDDLKRKLEPRATSGKRRLAVIEQLAAAGILVSVLAAPIIPFINDQELESLLERAADAGAGAAGYVVLRLPHELVELFDDWLRTHYPDRRQRVLNAIRELRGGRLYDASFEQRQRGSGVFAKLIARRFALARERLGLDAGRQFDLDTTRFSPPVGARSLRAAAPPSADDDQLALF
jgi:DNA repair photolyase